MTDKVRQTAPVIWDAIQQSQKVLIHCHPSPDADSVGSSLAMSFCLASLGKQVVHIGGDSPLSSSFARLPGFSEIQPKNLTQIDLSQFDTFLILDSSSPEQISKLAEINFPEDLNTIVIDHHPTNNGFGKINLVDPTYIAVGQIIYDLFILWRVDITPDMALCLFLAIYDDSGGFKYPLTTSETLLAAANLANINPDFSQAIFHHENSSNQSVLDYIGLALTNTVKYFSGRVAVSATSLQDLTSKGITPEHTEKAEISNMLKSVIGNELCVAAVERQPNVVNFSFRTRDADHFDVSKIASALGGGGHKAAAGATVRQPLATSVELMLKKIQETYPDIGCP